MALQKQNRHQLKRQLGLLSGSALIVGTMIGSGIFISPGGLLQSTGSVGMSLIVWLLCGVVSIIGALCYVELGCIVTTSGGEYAYLLEAFGSLHPFFGPLPAFLYQWSSILIVRPSSLAVLMMTFTGYILQPMFDNCGPPRFITLMVASIALITVTAVNCWSSKSGAITQNLFTIVKTIACLIIIGGGVVMLARGNTTYLATGFQGTSTDVSALALAFYDGLWAYTGWNNLNFCIEELNNPFKNLPRAIIISIPFVTVVYLLMNVAYFTALSPADLISSPAVAVSWANVVMPSVAIAVPIAVAISTFGSANGTIFSAGRITLAAAREGHCPGILAMLHKSKRTPLPAILLTGIISIILIFPSDIGEIINYFSFTIWFFYGLTFLSLVVMRWTKPNIERKFRMPIIFPMVMVLISFYLVIAPIIKSPRVEFLYAFVFVVSGIFVYIPFVYLKIHHKALNYVTTFLQLYLNVVPCEKNFTKQEE